MAIELSGTLVSLGSMKPGSIGVVSKLCVDDTDEARFITERLREMGFDEGLNIEVRHDGPFGRDPIAVRVGGMLVALRRREAEQVLVLQTTVSAA